MNALTIIPLSELQAMASSMAQARLFGTQTPEQLLSLMLIAQANGQHPAAAARDYDVIQGRPSKKAEAMLRDFLIAGGRVEWHAYTDAKCDATFSHPQGGSIRIDWDMARVKRAKISNEAMYQKYPRNMLRARCISEGVRTVYPVATGGMLAVEEAQGLPKDTGPAQVEAPPEALMTAAQDAASKGVSAYRAFWIDLLAEERRLLAGDHTALKHQAEEADKARTVEAEPSEPGFGDVVEHSQ